MKFLEPNCFDTSCTEILDMRLLLNDCMILSLLLYGTNWSKVALFGKANVASVMTIPNLEPNKIKRLAFHQENSIMREKEH